MNASLTAEQYDQGLRSYMLGIYNYMILGLLFSAGTAFFAEASGFTQYMVSSPVLLIAIILAPFALIFAMAGAEAYSAATMFILYLVFTVVEGAMLSVVLLQYTGVSVLSTLLAASGVFAGLSLYGYTTKRQLGGMGTALLGALFGLLVLMIIEIITKSPTLHFIVGAVGVLLFAVLIAYDTQKLKDAYATRAFVHGSQSKAMIWGALDLYLDFLNMFLFLLRFLGVSKND